MRRNTPRPDGAALNDSESDRSSFDVAQDTQQAVHVQWAEQDMDAGALELAGQVVQGVVEGIAEDGDLSGLLIAGEIGQSGDEIAAGGVVGIDDNEVCRFVLEEFQRLGGGTCGGDIVAHLVEQPVSRMGIGIG